MLQGQIKRDFQHNYLVFPALEERKDYQMQMLVHQRIQGVLPCMIRRVDGKQLFSYEISGKISMKQVFESRGMNFRDLEEVLKTLEKIVEYMKDYLLDMELLVLEPDYIFFEEGINQWFFVCFPREGENVYNAFHQLSKYILTVLNHKEEKAVQTGYALYQSTRNENFHLGQVLSQVKEQKKTDKEADFLPNASAVVEEREEQTIVVEPLFQESMFPSAETEDRKKGVLFSGKNKEKEINRKKEKVRERDKEQKKGIGRNQNRKWMFIGKDREKTVYGKPSTVLSYAAEGLFSYGNCSCLLKGITHPRETLQIQAFPYLIGSLECAVDGYVADKEVSHFHARMQREGSEYYITDLNSKTGTFINGQKLSTENQQKIVNGDKITFGNVEFIFACK